VGFHRRLINPFKRSICSRLQNLTISRDTGLSTRRTSAQKYPEASIRPPSAKGFFVI
jgi:hypothetical protein